MILKVLTFLIIMTSLSACKNGSGDVFLSSEAKKGKAVYLSSCISCHNANPKMAGSIGPEVANSSLELLTARIMHAKYPPNYKPKRQSKLMVAIPMVEKDIPAIHAYLNSY